MRLMRIQEQLYTSPMLITQEGWNVIHTLVQSKLRNDQFHMPKAIKAEDVELEDFEDPSEMRIENGVAWTPIQGPIGKKLSLLAQMCGACDIDVLKDKIDMAATHPDVEVIAFDCDSPGGSVAGLPELAEYIKYINDNIKPCIAIVDGKCCSAAYYLMAGCDEIYAVGKTSYIGSIGVYNYLLDTSRQYQMDGVEPVLIKAGTVKGEGLPGMPISDEMKARLQKEVDYIYGMFTKHVTNCRKGIAESTMQGHAYLTEEAIQLGLVDGYVANKNEIFVK